jgi:GAF domain-containing protein
MTHTCERAGGNPEAGRLAALRRYAILDTPPEAAFDDFTTLASEICDAPMSLISLVDEHRQWFKSAVGVGLRETPIEQSICRHAILQKELLIVPDATQDARFRDNPLVTGEPHLRFYAGAQLESSDGQPIGALCVLDRQPRSITPAQGRALEALARQVMNLMELRLVARELSERTRELEQAMGEIRTLRGILPICAQCKRIRDESAGSERWLSMEQFLHRHTEATFSHGMCPGCMAAYLADLDRLTGRG